jgi:hypothetical protein
MGVPLWRRYEHAVQQNILGRNHLETGKKPLAVRGLREPKEVRKPD